MKNLYVKCWWNWLQLFLRNPRPAELFQPWPSILRTRWVFTGKQMISSSIPTHPSPDTDFHIGQWDVANHRRLKITFAKAALIWYQSYKSPTTVKLPLLIWNKLNCVIKYLLNCRKKAVNFIELGVYNHLSQANLSIEGKGWNGSYPGYHKDDTL